jgi:hypothetical protein
LNPTLLITGMPRAAASAPVGWRGATDPLLRHEAPRHQFAAVRQGAEADREARGPMEQLEAEPMDCPSFVSSKM